MKVTSWITLTLVLVVVAVLLQVAGFVAPLWIWLSQDSFEAGLGLWFSVGCSIKDTCDSPAPNVSFVYTKAEVWTDPEFAAVRALETLGVAGGVLVLLFMIVYRMGYGTWTGMEQLNMAAFVTCILTWMCIVAGLIVFCAFYWPVVGESPLVNIQSFPWSLVLCLLAAAIFVLACALIRAKCRDRSSLKHALPVAGDTHMEQYPLTKHGLLHRYFAPFYRGIRGQSQIGYQSEAKGMMQSMNTRLVEADEYNQVAAIDNAAFYADDQRQVSNNYRYLPSGQYQADQTETMMRRSLPTAVVTYAGDNSTDVQGMYASQHQGPSLTHAQNDLNRQARRADDGLRHTADDATRDVTHRDAAYRDAAAAYGRNLVNGQAYAVGDDGREAYTREVHLRNSGVDRETRDASFAQGGVSREQRGDYREASLAQGGVARDQHAYYNHNSGKRTDNTTQQTKYVSGQAYDSREHGAKEAHGSREDGAAYTREVQLRNGDVSRRSRVHSGGGDRAVIHGDQDYDAPNIVVRDAEGNVITERVTTTTTTTYVTEGHERRGGLKVTELESNDGRDGALKSRGYISSTLSDASVNLYDDTYIYRPCRPDSP